MRLRFSFFSSALLFGVPPFSFFFYNYLKEDYIGGVIDSYIGFSVELEGLILN